MQVSSGVKHVVILKALSWEIFSLLRIGFRQNAFIRAHVSAWRKPQPRFTKNTPKNWPCNGPTVTWLSSITHWILQYFSLPCRGSAWQVLSCAFLSVFSEPLFCLHLAIQVKVRKSSVQTLVIGMLYTYDPGFLQLPVSQRLPKSYDLQSFELASL